MKKKAPVVLIALTHFVLASSYAESNSPVRQVSSAQDTVQQTIKFTAIQPIIDGLSSEQEWRGATWYPVNVPILGALPSKQDFSGDYRMLWDENYLYINFQF